MPQLKKNENSESNKTLNNFFRAGMDNFIYYFQQHVVTMIYISSLENGLKFISKIKDDLSSNVSFIF